MQITTLWIDGQLSTLCRMSIGSFQHHGMDVVLYTYNPSLVVPAGVEVRDAREFMPESDIDRYRYQPGGRLPLVSDRWHYLAAYKLGGWFAHLDTTLLRPLDELDDREYVFGPHHRTGISMALWKIPAGCEALKYCVDYEWTLPPTDWHAGMYPISEAVERFGLTEHRLDCLCGDDFYFKALANLRLAGVPFRDDYYAIHWCNSGQPAGMFDDAKPGSFIDELKQRYGVE